MNPNHAAWHIKKRDLDEPDPSAAFRIAELDRDNVLSLDATTEPMNIVKSRKAIDQIFKGSAHILEARGDIQFHTSKDLWLWPSVIVVTTMSEEDFEARRARTLNMTKRNIFIRDNYECQFVGCTAAAQDRDHVIPRSKGGRDVWTNVVASCFACNRYKADMTLEQAGMKLKNQPRKPTYEETLIKFASTKLTTREEWYPYLEAWSR